MINFLQPLVANKLRMAYNNDIVRFTASNSSAPVSCNIYDSFLKINAVIYPNPQGQFYFNFRPYISAIINTRGFNDTLNPDIQPIDENSYVYNFMNGTFTQRNIVFNIKYENDTTENVSYVLSWLAGVQQLDNYHDFRLGDLLVLSPFKKNTTNSYYLKYWEGYPFDIPFFTVNTSMTIINQTNLLSAEFSTIGYGERLIVSDGRTDVTLEDILPFNDGFNELRFVKNPLIGPYDKYVTLEKVPYSCGVYLKWYNAMGGYSYWLFENTYSIDRSTKHIGEIERDNSNLEDTFSRVVSIGKESQDTIRVVAELLNDDERTIVEGIIDSPKVYLFTGAPFSKNSSSNWIEVSLKTSSARVKNPRQPLTNFTFDLELPERYTQTL